jgi:NDP-sugar pyrophosphorylase family protein
VTAAGEGRRLRPLTDRWPKPVLPIDGRPVIVTLLHELARCGIDAFTVVTGHLAEQVEAILDGLPYEIDVVRQPEPLGSADAVRHAAAEPPYLVSAADTVYGAGDAGRVLQAFAAADGAAGAIAVRRQPGRPDHTRIEVEEGRVVRVIAPDTASGLTAAPLLVVGAAVAERLDEELPGPPYQVADAFQRAIDAGGRVLAVEIGRTRDLTAPQDLVRENFPYLQR